MYLSQLLINLRSRSARNDLADRYELHRTLMSGFPESLPPHERVLYRVEQGSHSEFNTIIVQSQSMPDWQQSQRISDPRYLLAVPNVRQVVADVSDGMRLPFRLQVNPTVKRNGKRHAIDTDAGLTEWLERKAVEHGFSVKPFDMQFIKLGKKYGKKRMQTWHAVQFDGFLTIENQTTFLQSLYTGIGSAKAFGFGLLSIPYPRL